MNFLHSKYGWLISSILWAIVTFCITFGWDGTAKSEDARLGRCTAVLGYVQERVVWALYGEAIADEMVNIEIIQKEVVWSVPKLLEAFTEHYENGILEPWFYETIRQMMTNFVMEVSKPEEFGSTCRALVKVNPQLAREYLYLKRKDETPEDYIALKAVMYERELFTVEYEDDPSDGVRILDIDGRLTEK